MSEKIGLDRQSGLLAIKLDPKKYGEDCPDLGSVCEEPHCDLLWDVCGLNFDDPTEDTCPRRAEEIKQALRDRIAELEKKIDELCATGRNLLIRDKQYIGTWWHLEFEAAIKRAGKEAADAVHKTDK